MAMNTILNIIPIDIMGRQYAAFAALRLQGLKSWKAARCGHTTILRNRQLPSTKDYCVPRLTFTKGYSVTLPSRESWLEGVPGSRDAIRFYTDGSKLENRVGGGVYSEKLGIKRSFRLPDHCSVFQAELAAIQEAVDSLKLAVIATTEIYIYSDSQAALMALDSVTINSETVANCRKSLNVMAEQFALHLVWVPGHSDIPGNEKADELARAGTSSPLSPAWKRVGMPLASCKLLLRENFLEEAASRWERTENCNTTKLTWPKWDVRRSREILTLNKGDMSLAIGLLTGHILIGRHAERLGVSHNDYCRSCHDEEEPESIRHLLCDCPALGRKRQVF
ncbi:PREDICTED: uncharacterized protein LOC108360437 [Rhagoletis zephyria]|uniref:uncharacterized protein LOC108360437 n=1 Tax=Rhagoletis zephyria TaxID=28612 RepID=UPI00081177EB|nr:PREDICTED: uncharacterized protein LOC108360437 [Rhagoletis zephyria]